MIQKNLLKKTVVFSIIILFFTSAFGSSIGGHIRESNLFKDLELDSKNEYFDSSYENIDWWPMFRHDVSHSGYSTSDAPDTNNTKWNFNVSGNIEFSSPAIYDGRVYIASVHLLWSDLYCLDADTGDEIWKISDRRTWSSPAVAEGKVVIGSGLNNDEGLVTCYNAYFGDWIWSITPDKGVKSSPVIVDGKVYVGSNIGKVYCIDLEEGYLHWTYRTKDEFESSPAVVNGKVYIGSIDKNVYCLDAETGKELWIKNIGYEIHLSSPTIYNEKIYIGTWDNESNPGYVFCLDASTGEHIWDFTTDQWIDSSPAVYNDKIYIGSGDSRLYCIDADTGNKLWHYYTGGELRSSPAVADGKVYFGSENGVFCIDAETGDEIWKYESTNVDSSPAIAIGKLYIGINNKIFCFYDDEGPDLQCTGYLEFFDIKPNSTLRTSFQVYNNGKPASQLDWEVESYPEWGEWTSNPASGENLKPEDGPFTVEVELIVPEDGHTVFEGKIKVINSENPDDHDTIYITVATPRNKTFKNSVFISLFEKYFNSYLFFKRILNFRY